MATFLPNPDQAVLDTRKMEDYCLNPLHPRGRHKARVFREALHLQRSDAAWLRVKPPRLQRMNGALTGAWMPQSGDRISALW
jgi:hypothetical protein